MHPTDKAARVAGVFYVLMGVFAPFALIYVPGKLFVWENASATARNILTSEMLFRFGIAGELFSAIAFLLLAMALYRLLAEVNKNHARLMVGMILVSVGITFLNILNEIAALILFRGADFLSVLDKSQRDALGLLFLQLFDQGHAVNEIFWGLWLFPFGLLVMRSRFLPRILGLLLVLNGFAYVATSFTWLFAPMYAKLVFRASMPALLGELWIMLWLLIRGAKPRAVAATASI